MTDLPDHIRQAMHRLRQIRERALEDNIDMRWLAPAYKDMWSKPESWIHCYNDDLRTVAFWCIDQQREFDT